MKSIQLQSVFLYLYNEKLSNYKTNTMPFTSLGLSASLLKALAVQNYTQPYPIQLEVIPAILKRKDVLGIAPTGSGKTAGYVMPLLMNMQLVEASRSRNVNVLVLVPTRELAVQVREVFRLFSVGLPQPVKTLAVFGGVSINPQMMALSGVNVLIATPGRLLELVESNAVHLNTIETLVLDEADKMLNLGFKEEVTRVLALLPEKRQNLLFSATLSDDVNNITQMLLHEPLVIKIESEVENIDLITQIAYFVTNEKKGPLLRYLIKHNDLKQVLVFTSSIYSADNVVDKLRKNGIDAMAIHSKKSQGSRTDALDEFKSGRLRVLVATDLISRGIDIQFLPHVINYELPRSPKEYIHRIGRTGRAESPGEAISFVTPADKDHFKVIQKKMGKWITMIDSESINLHGF
ncbi:MAG: DEAD/DEAH box helicase [Bacteroidales bacterium]|nr:DEAD/DEAH box helicase [Bacteroidales bacterium]